ncbi:hypothetical protein FTV88_3045 [Heliorestis convoluta]|uniref:Uncharacterized protein n=1 Tax=Heliorestis convoluta TaxID=356322 RepID=A0A5Q2NA17_9FIRM|nr:hypothetical protein FTV88_3045 [Heliorestis convoluta]
MVMMLQNKKQKKQKKGTAENLSLQCLFFNGELITRSS